VTAATRHVALGALLAGCGDPPAPEPVCVDGPATPADTPVWTGDVDALFAAHCTGCHQTGGLAPFPLDTYEAATTLPAAVRASIVDKRMPPFLPAACGECQTFRHSPALSPEDAGRIIGWIDAGFPEGEPRAATPPPRELPRLTAVDATLDPVGAYTPSTAQTDDYRCFLVDTPFATDTFLTGYEVVPGDPATVHHLLLFATPDSAGAQALDDADEGPGWTCFGGAGVDASLAGVWAPGAGAVPFPEGTGLKITGGQRFILQIHYNTVNGVRPDDTRVNLSTATTVARPGAMTSQMNDQLGLPPGQAQVVRTSDREIDGDALIWGVVAHMHTRGQSFRLERVSPDGGTDCLLDVPRWDFHWQGFWFYEQPVRVQANDISRMTCTYDTSRETERIDWGEGTADEMCIAYAFVTNP
jgi:hypothetical protein